MRRLGSGRLPSVGPSTERRRGFVAGRRVVAGARATPADAAVPADAAAVADPVEAAAAFFSRGCGAVRATTTLLPCPSVVRVYSSGPQLTDGSRLRPARHAAPMWHAVHVGCSARGCLASTLNRVQRRRRQAMPAAQV